MYPLIDAAPHRIPELAVECGFGDKFGQLCTPLTNYRVGEFRFAIDNGGFTKACPRPFRNLLQKCLPFQERCMFVTVPDVYGDGPRTLEVFHQWKAEIKALGYKVALVAQPGLEHLNIPWGEIDAIFIGGLDGWRESDAVKGIIRAAQWLEKHVHLGRVNTAKRWEAFQPLGIDTFDGSGLARPYPGARRNRGELAEARLRRFIEDIY